MKDQIVRVLGGDEEFIISACVSGSLVEQARLLHGDSPVSIRALGELLTASALMGDLMKGGNDILTLEIEGDGDLKKVIATADSQGNVKGFSSNPNATLGIGKGDLLILKDQGMRTPYNSMTPLSKKGIAETLNSYYNQSVQLPTFFCLGVKVDSEGKVPYSFGYMVQALPFAKPEIANAIVANLQAMPPMDSILEKEFSPQQILSLLLKGIDGKTTSQKDIFFRCSCSHEKGLALLQGLNEKEKSDILAAGKPIEITCGFCGKKYSYSFEELKAALGKRP